MPLQPLPSLFYQGGGGGGMIRPYLDNVRGSVA